MGHAAAFFGGGQDSHRAGGAAWRAEHRYHESLNNLVPTDVYLEDGQKSSSNANAASANHPGQAPALQSISRLNFSTPDELTPPATHIIKCLKLSDNGQV
jgi:hypothetical protein